MVDVKKYNPSNKRFQKHTQHFVNNQTMKGHLNDDKKDKNQKTVNGLLAKVNSKNLNGEGWHVIYNKKILKCRYGDNIIYLPPYEVKGDWYIPKEKCNVEVTIDNQHGIRTITKIDDAKKKPIEMDNNGVKIEGSGTSSIKISENVVEATGEHLSVENDVIVDTSNDDDLPDKISVTDMYKEIQVLKNQISDTDGE